MKHKYRNAKENINDGVGNHNQASTSKSYLNVILNALVVCGLWDLRLLWDIYKTYMSRKHKYYSKSQPKSNPQ